ncbi:hypothetical protein GGS23DRAFT_189189 [Durotheca rogersii]|uniref:uncharacterized protein n=1 Tax=Durotheca rogersii TaxID=419775 RepID=UPI00221E42A4|nr:uncharacterized protein GGS23DRAFT_189189 [Durotheca rogersii]KAI5867681.1 hypothetical protein GGS23DRAFT_189189 [Durotheca rogersii]
MSRLSIRRVQALTACLGSWRGHLPPSVRSSEARVRHLYGRAWEFSSWSSPDGRVGRKVVAAPVHTTPTCIWATWLTQMPWLGTGADGRVGGAEEGDVNGPTEDLKALPFSPAEKGREPAHRPSNRERGERVDHGELRGSIGPREGRGRGRQ